MLQDVASQEVTQQLLSEYDRKEKKERKWERRSRVRGREFVFGLDVLFLSSSDTDCTDAADFRTNRAGLPPRQRPPKNVGGDSTPGPNDAGHTPLRA